MQSSQQSYDDVEVRIFKGQENNFSAEISFADGGASCQLPPLMCEELAKIQDSKQYGVELFNWLFREQLLESFRRLRWETEAYTRSLGSSSRIRLKLWLDPQVPELHQVWWEAMRDPSRDEAICLDAAFSRFLRVNRARGWTISERPLKMLCVLSNPKKIEKFDLQRFDMSLEKNLLGAATDSIEQFLNFRMLSTPTAEKFQEELSKGYHIVHLVAHAATVEGEYCLMLADKKGTARPIPFKSMLEVLNSSDSIAPYFVFLTTPSTADENVGKMMVSFAHQLVEAGVQAVLTIQSAMEIKNLELFTERFYNTLIRTGTVDMAVAMARTAIYEPNEWQWVNPVLYMRTPDAQLFQPLSDSLEATVQRIADVLRSAK
jgi:hypothetical protein